MDARRLRLVSAAQDGCVTSAIPVYVLQTPAKIIDITKPLCYRELHASIVHFHSYTREYFCHGLAERTCAHRAE